MLFTEAIHFSSDVRDKVSQKMKLIMTDTRTRFDDKSLDALMGISFSLEPLTQYQIKVLISEWKNRCVRRIFAESV